MHGEEIVTALVSFLAIHVLVKSNFVFEALGFVILAIVSHLVGNIAEGNNSKELKSRPGASTGVFLGSITWPLVFAFRLASSISGTNDRYFFWSAVLCSFRINSLIFSTFSSKGSDSNGFIESWIVCMLLAWLTGLQSIIMLPFQAFSSGVLLKKIFQRFPGSATIGESSVVASGFSIYIGNIVRCALPENLQDGISGMLQVAVLGLSLMPSLYKFVMYITGKWSLVSLATSVIFVAYVFAPGWFWFVTGIQQHPILWILNFMMDKPVQTFGLCFYWLCSLCIVPFLYHVARRNQIPHILLRKAYHILAVTMFIPALFFEPQFLHLAFSGAFVVFSIAEMIRIWNVPALGPKVNDFMGAFADSRDSNELIVSHFSLLLGCALPLWLHMHSKARPLAAFAGILSIGIGDTMASFIGYNYGSWRLSKTNKKTVEGTSAGILSLALACYLVQLFLPGCFSFSKLLIACVSAGLVEAFTTQLDNVFVPLVFYAILCI